MSMVGAKGSNIGGISPALVDPAQVSTGTCPWHVSAPPPTGQSDEGLRSFHEAVAASPGPSCPASSEASMVAGRQLSGVANLDPATKPYGDRRRNGRSGGQSSFARLPCHPRPPPPPP